MTLDIDISELILRWETDTLHPSDSSDSDKLSQSVKEIFSYTPHSTRSIQSSLKSMKGSKYMHLCLPIKNHTVMHQIHLLKKNKEYTQRSFLQIACRKVSYR